MRPDVADFYNGISFDAYRLLGAHPAGSERGWLFTVWAPHAKRVQAVGDWNSWDLYHCDELAMCEDGLWRGRAPMARAGQLYKYNIQGPDGVWRMRPDPFAFSFESPPGTASRLEEPGEALPSLRGKLPGDALRLYEVHAASWRRHWDGRYYSGGELASALVPYAKERGFTHVEFLPLAEYPYDGSWGYQGCGYFAPTHRIGGAAGFRTLVQALHAAGLGVVMDFVPGHFAPDEGRLSCFDGAPLLESGLSGWGSPEFNLSSGPVRSFLLSSAAYWVWQCGCDGVRVDAVSSVLHSQGRDGAEFFRTLTAGLHARFPGVLLVAEDSERDTPATAPTHRGGLGFDRVWDLNWSGATLGYFSLSFGSRAAQFSTFAAAQFSAGTEWGLSCLSHDDCAPPRATVWQSVYGDERQRFAQVRLILLLQAVRPGGCLLFAGTEFGSQRPFEAGREPDWEQLGRESCRTLDDFCAALGRFVPSHPALCCAGRVEPAGQDPTHGLFGFVRRGGGETLLIAVNAGDREAQGVFRVPGRIARQVFAASFRDSARHSADGGTLRLTMPALSGGIWVLE